MNKKTKAFITILLFFISTMYSTILNALNINIPIINPEKVSASSAIFQLSIELVFMIGMVIIYWREIKEAFIDFSHNKGSYIKRILLSWVIALVGYLGVNMLIAGIFDVDMPNNLLQQRLLEAAPIYLMVSMLIASPIIEELTFRKSFYDIIESKWGYIIISALLNGFFYVGLSFTTELQLLFIISYAILGGCMAHAYYKTNNILVPLGIHLIHNVLFFIINI